MRKNTLYTIFSAAVLAGTLGLSPRSAGAEDGVISKVSTSDGSYCHTRFQAIDEDTVFSSEPRLKDSDGGDVVDDYGSCNEGPLSRDVVQQERIQEQRHMEDEEQ